MVSNFIEYLMVFGTLAVIFTAGLFIGHSAFPFNSCEYTTLTPSLIFPDGGENITQANEEAGRYCKIQGYDNGYIELTQYNDGSQEIATRCYSCKPLPTQNYN